MSPPTSRDDFNMAIVCALPHEQDAVNLILEEDWDDLEETLGKAPGDENIYTLGRIGSFNVVVALLCNMGKAAAAGTAARLQSSFPRVKLTFLTGICGGVPGTIESDDLLLGDVVVGSTVVQYDLGRQTHNEFNMKRDVNASLGRGPKNARVLVTKLKTRKFRSKVEDRAAELLTQVQEIQAKERRGGRSKYRYPGASTDVLFAPQYFHKHRKGSCSICGQSLYAVCDRALGQSCEEVGCDTTQGVKRTRLDENQTSTAEEAQKPAIFVGNIGSADTVMKNGQMRDNIAAQDGLLAFEMEGAGVFDETPCVVVKGVCDYADSHKNKKWQDFAAATAACVTRALLEQYPKTDDDTSRLQHAAESSSPAGAGGSVVFNGNVSGRNVVSGINHSGGGTTNYTFNA